MPECGTAKVTDDDEHLQTYSTYVAGRAIAKQHQVVLDSSLEEKQTEAQQECHLPGLFL
jgi:hypothetical protein